MLISIYQTEYAVEDADVTWQLKQIFEKELEENHLTKLFKEIEIPLVHVLSKNGTGRD